MQVTSESIQIGFLIIRYYGIVLMLGAVMGGVLAASEAKRRGYDPEIVWDLLIWLIIGGVLGARLWHILTPSPSAIAAGKTTVFYLTHPLDALAIWNGGLGIEGSIAGGIIALLLFTNRNKLNSLEWLDIGAPSLALGQAIGRWGNFFNQELYGKPTVLPWKLYIDPAHRLAGFENISYYHPLFAYESILSLANMLFLIWISRQYSDKLKKGDVFLSYLVIYPTIRFFLEYLRLDSSYLAGININQIIAAIVAICALIVLIWRHRSQETEDATVQMTSVSSLVGVTSGIDKETPAKSAVRKPAARKPALTTSKKNVVRKQVSKKPSAKKDTK